jgi:Two-component sensor kinase N-terminal
VEAETFSSGDLIEVRANAIVVTPLPQFYDAPYFKESVRVGAFLRDLVQPVGFSVSDKLVIQVAESTTSRQQFSASFF